MEHGHVLHEKPHLLLLIPQDHKIQLLERLPQGGCGYGRGLSILALYYIYSSHTSSGHRSGGGTFWNSSYSQEPSHPGLCGLSNLGQ